MSKFKKLTAGILCTIAAVSFAATKVLAQTYDYTYSTSGADALFAGFSTVMILVYCCALIFGLVYLVFTVLMIVDVAKRPDEQANKVVWILVMLFIPLGTILYYFLVKRKFDTK
ncbi:MAG TPA: PLD nuclease N-terminal domain-containing protein [Candidatus Dojkabacteria bacterium]|nr:PLD nuclease N-terminal domain-containing protein [Candidatus Dojkabacteria bacterium]